MARTFTYTPEEVRAKADEYIEECKRKRVAPLINEFALQLDLRGDSLTDWLKHPEYSEPICKHPAITSTSY